MQPLIFSDVTISYSEFQKINRQFSLKTRWPRIIIFEACILLVFWMNFSRPDDNIPFFLKAGLVIGFLLLSLGGMLFQFERTIRKQYAANKLLQSPVSYSLTKEGIVAESLIHSAHSAWPAVQGFRQFGTWYCLFLTTGGVFFLNPRNLDPPATEVNLVQLLQDVGVRQL